jgi:ADP-ribose pyrophosphatase YjhB (NUDIX family)
MEKDFHCSFCGNRFEHDAPWPRRCLACGNSTYRNPLPVAVVLLPMEGGVVVIRRNTEPRKGTLTLPGGYIDYGESWQEGAQRELLEETGIEIDRNDLSLYDVQNGLDHTLVIVGLAREIPLNRLKPFTSKETQEVTIIDRPIELGFPLHTEVVKRFFTEKGAGKKER